MKTFLGPIALGAMLVAAAPADKPDPRLAALDAGPGTIDVSGYPEDQQRGYAVFAAKCSKCHPLARPINSRFSGEEWKRYMKRMVRRPNSGINEEQAAIVYAFLVYYSTHRGP